MNSKHVTINYTDNNSYPVLLEKCEHAREEMRNYPEEAVILRNLSNNIKRAKDGTERNSNWYKHSIEDHATELTIKAFRKNEREERKVREVLRDLKLPENHVVTITEYTRDSSCVTNFYLEPDDKKRRDLLEKSELERIRGRYIKPLLKIARQVDRDYIVNIELENKKPNELIIRNYKWIETSANIEKSIQEFKKKGFNTDMSDSLFFANKAIQLNGNEKLKDLKKQLKNSLVEIL